MKRILNKIKSVLTSRSVIGAVLIAVSLWAYVNLNIEYTSNVDVPLEVKLPPNRSIESPLPKKISVEVRGSGWHIFSLQYFNSGANCIVDLSEQNIDSVVELNRNDLIKSIKYLLNAQAIDVIPQNLTVKAGKIGENSVIVKPVINIKPRDGFMVVGDIEVKPDLINIQGNITAVNKIQEWSTVEQNFTDVFKSFTTTLQLTDSLSSMIKLSLKTVKAKVNIQQIAEFTFPDVEIKIKGGTLPSDHHIKPSRITIIVRGGSEQLGTLSRDEIEASLNYNEVIHDTTGILIPEIYIPGKLEIINPKPIYIYHTKTLSSR